jgi:hypothetical protein
VRPTASPPLAAPTSHASPTPTSIHLVGVAVWFVALVCGAGATVVVAVVSTCVPDRAVLPLALITAVVTAVPALTAVAARAARTSAAPWIAAALATFGLGAWAVLAKATADAPSWCSALG